MKAVMQEKKVKNIGYKQMLILINPELLTDIKARALFKNISLKAWVLQAIEQARIIEDKYK